MFKFFKKRCPVCKMTLPEQYVEGFGNKFCSNSCKETYRVQKVKEQAKTNNKGCCH